MLYWMELQYLSVAFKRLRQHGNSEEDVWWIWVDSEVRGPFRFVEVLKAVLDGSGCTNIVHHSRASEDPTPWETLYYQPWWSNGLIARFWTVAFWFTLALLGWIVVTRALPWGSHKLVDAAYWLAVACIIVKRKSLRIWIDGLRVRLTCERSQKFLHGHSQTAHEGNL